MYWQLDNRSEKLREPLALLLKERGMEPGAGGVVFSWERTEEEGLRVEREQKCVRIFCRQKAHFFRGVALFLARREELSFSVEEHVYLDRRGVMVDCSRNAVPRVETLKAYIRMLALLGMNELLLYMEDLYELPEYPRFGAFRGRYTREELAECDRYGAMFGITLVPAIQTLAHLKTFLRWPENRALRDNEENLLPEDENVYRLIDAMLKELSGIFSGRRIHLGMDEAHALGLGAYLKKHGYQDRIGIMKRHLSQVTALCRKWGLEPMIWSDLYFSLAPGNEGYYGVPGDFSWKEEGKPDSDLTMVYWDYYHHEEAVYERMLRLHKKLTDKVCFAAGVWTWNGIAPNYSKAFATIRTGMRVIKREEVRDAFVTVWMDNGAETPFAASYLPLVLFAEECFSREPDDARIQERLDVLGLGSLFDLWLLDRFDRLEETPEGNPDAVNPSKELLYQDPLLGMFDGQYQGYDLCGCYGRLAENLREAARRCGALEDLFSYYQALAEFLSVKGNLGMELRGAYQRRDRSRLTEILEDQIPACLQALQKLREQREEIWFSECKPQGYEVLDIRLGGVHARLTSAQKRLQRYLDGEIPQLEELEEAPLPYEQIRTEGKQPPVPCNLWEHIVTAGNMAGV